MLAEALTDASPDLMRSLLQTMIDALLSADVDAVVGAEWGKPSADRVAQRNGYPRFFIGCLIVVVRRRCRGRGVDSGMRVRQWPRRAAVAGLRSSGL